MQRRRDASACDRRPVVMLPPVVYNQLFGLHLRGCDVMADSGLNLSGAAEGRIERTLCAFVCVPVAIRAFGHGTGAGLWQSLPPLGRQGPALVFAPTNIRLWKASGARRHEGAVRGELPNLGKPLSGHRLRPVAASDWGE